MEHNLTRRPASLRGQARLKGRSHNECVSALGGVFEESRMLAETRGYFSEMLRQDLSLLQLVDSDWAMLNQRLGEHYGIPDVTGCAVRKTELVWIAISRTFEKSNVAFNESRRGIRQGSSESFRARPRVCRIRSRST